MNYHYEQIPMMSTPRKCTVCQRTATTLRFKFAQTHEVNRSSKEFVCGDHAQEDSNS